MRLRHLIGMAGTGHKWSFAWTLSNVWLLIRKRTIEPISAAQNDLVVGYVSFGISKRKKLASSDFIAFCTTTNS